MLTTKEIQAMTPEEMERAMSKAAHGVTMKFIVKPIVYSAVAHFACKAIMKKLSK